VGGLFYVTMFGVAFMVGLRVMEVHYTNKEDIGLGHFVHGVEYTVPLSKTDHNALGVREVVTRINASENPFKHPVTGVKVVMDVDDLMTSCFRRSGCLQYLRADGASKSGAMWWGRWLSVHVFELYAHDLMAPLNDLQNLTHLMYDETAVRMGDALTDDAVKGLIAAEIVKGVQDAVAAVTATGLLPKHVTNADVAALRAHLEAARVDAEQLRERAASVEGEARALRSVLGMQRASGAGGAGGSAPME
jgi:hypothetical protein